MSNENKNHFCKCNETSSRTTGGDNGYQEKFEAMVEINHGLKKTYEEVRKRYEMLCGEKRGVAEQNKKLNGRITALKKRQKFLESELVRLAGALYAQQGSNGSASTLEEQCELLKSQMVVYKEDFETERQAREKLNEEKEKYKNKLEDAEEAIRQLTAELDVCKALGQALRERRNGSENDYLSERGATHRLQVQLVHPYHFANETWEMVQRQMRGILPWNPAPMPLFYGGNAINERRGMEQHTLDNCIPDSLT